MNSHLPKEDVRESIPDYEEFLLTRFQLTLLQNAKDASDAQLLVDQTPTPVLLLELTTEGETLLYAIKPKTNYQQAYIL